MPSSCGYLEGRSHSLWNFKKSTLRKMHFNIMSCTLGSVCVSWEAHQLPSPSSSFCDSLCIYGDSLCIPSKVLQSPEAFRAQPSEPESAHASSHYLPKSLTLLGFLAGSLPKNQRSTYMSLPPPHHHHSPSSKEGVKTNAPPVCLLRATRLAYCLCFSLRDSDKRAWYSYTQHIIYSCK